MKLKTNSFLVFVQGEGPSQLATGYIITFGIHEHSFAGYVHAYE